VLTTSTEAILNVGVVNTLLCHSVVNTLLCQSRFSQNARETRTKCTKAGRQKGTENVPRGSHTILAPRVDPLGARVEPHDFPVLMQFRPMDPTILIAQKKWSTWLPHCDAVWTNGSGNLDVPETGVHRGSTQLPHFDAVSANGSEIAGFLGRCNNIAMPLWISTARKFGCIGRNRIKIGDLFGPPCGSMFPQKGNLRIHCQGPHQLQIGKFCGPPFLSNGDFRIHWPKPHQNTQWIWIHLTERRMGGAPQSSGFELGGGVRCEPGWQSKKTEGFAAVLTTCNQKGTRHTQGWKGGSIDGST
jgi:hypothetical protein